MFPLLVAFLFSFIARRWACAPRAATRPMKLRFFHVHLPLPYALRFLFAYSSSRETWNIGSILLYFFGSFRRYTFAPAFSRISNGPRNLSTSFSSRRDCLIFH